MRREGATENSKLDTGERGSALCARHDFAHLEPESYVRLPYKVQVHADYGARFTVYVRAIGWHEATGLAIDAAERSGHFDVRPGVPQQISEAEYEQGRVAA